MENTETFFIFVGNVYFTIQSTFETSKYHFAVNTDPFTHREKVYLEMKILFKRCQNEVMY